MLFFTIFKCKISVFQVSSEISAEQCLQLHCPQVRQGKGATQLQCHEAKYLFRNGINFVVLFLFSDFYSSGWVEHIFSIFQHFLVRPKSLTALKLFRFSLYVLRLKNFSFSLLFKLLKLCTVYEMKKMFTCHT